MKKIMMILMIAIGVSSVTFGQTKMSNDKNASKKGGDEQAVRQTINDLTVALRNNDTTELDRIYGDNYTFVGDTGMIMTKAERIAAFKSGDLKYESISFEVVSIHLYGNTATAVTRVTNKFAPGVKSLGGKFITSLTFVKIKGRWQLVAAGNTRVGE